MKLDKLLWLALTLLALSASAEEDKLDWKESEAPPAPAFNKDRLLSIDMPHYVTLQFGVDPATLVITPEGIVRYVVVASNASGSISAMYEGIRCATGEVKTYARFASSGKWAPIQDPQWRGLNDNRPSRHALALANQGVCESPTIAARSVTAIVNALKSPYQGSTR
jgi:hypothetical protein